MLQNVEGHEAYPKDHMLVIKPITFGTSNEELQQKVIGVREKIHKSALHHSNVRAKYIIISFHDAKFNKDNPSANHTDNPSYYIIFFL